MKWAGKILLILFALFLSVMDTAFFSNLTINGASIVSVYMLSIIFAINGDFERFLLFVGATVIFFSIFSSLPIYLIFLLFLVIPSFLLFLRKKYLPHPSVPVSLFYFIIVDFLFEIILLLQSKEWSRNGFEILGYFILINSVFGVIMFYIVNKIKNKFGRKEN